MEELIKTWEKEYNDLENLKQNEVRHLQYAKLNSKSLQLKYCIKALKEKLPIQNIDTSDRTNKNTDNKIFNVEEFEEFMSEMLEEYNYDKDTVMVTTAFAQALASEWCKKKLLANKIMYEINYLKKGDSICTNDLKNKEKIATINLNQISSFTDIRKLYTPFSGIYKGDYIVVSMQNGDRYYINKREYFKLNKILNFI